MYSRMRFRDIARLKTIHGVLYDWMTQKRDVGLIPAPILEGLGRERCGIRHLSFGVGWAAGRGGLADY